MNHNRIKNLVRLERDQYLHSTRMLFPFILYAGYLVIAYNVAPQNILDSFSVCSLMVFICMLAIGVMYDEISSDMIEQAVLVKMEQGYILYLAKVLFLSIVSCLLATLSIIYPVVIHLINGSSFFTRNFVISDILSGFFLFFLTGTSGALLGLFVNKRVIHKRSIGILIAFFLAFAIIVKGSINEEFAFTQLITWVFPPVYNLSISYSLGDYFSLNETIFNYIWLLVYCILEGGGYIWLMTKLRME